MGASFSTIPGAVLPVANQTWRLDVLNIAQLPGTPKFCRGVYTWGPGFTYYVLATLAIEPVRARLTDEASLDIIYREAEIQPDALNPNLSFTLQVVKTINTALQTTKNSYLYPLRFLIIVKDLKIYSLASQMW